MRRTRTSRFALVCLAVIAAPLLVLAAAFDPATTWWFPSCPLAALTGWACPLCGSLRALHALLAGSPLRAVAFNPLAIAGLAAWLVARERTLAFCFSRTGLALLVAFGILRNL